ncbi:chromosome replication/partitioning protein (plasmid) [Borrelia sp. A-FGy1]|uniref:chromosome replication/partitioning protein n=1 Tax=Borrelia sp. A-FGy1 TaxID=2608247 RepID=UPI0015F7013D|nr:chromosome replication/partitioning protein [Borrelia sp. A-FGy1]QMU99857.1 chromosome replication/partitioning protein [Borrelia sp. A-FGy1]
MNIILNSRELKSKDTTEDDKVRTHYKKLKERLIINLKDQINNILDNIKIIKEIKDKGLYVLDGHAKFEGFIKEYRLAKSQVYNYLKVGNALSDGIIKENYIIENGIKNTLFLINTKYKDTQDRKLKQNLINPLRFQLKSEDSYKFYRKNIKLAGFILDDLFLNKQDLLKEFINGFESLKSKKQKKI